MNILSKFVNKFSPFFLEKNKQFKVIIGFNKPIHTRINRQESHEHINKHNSKRNQSQLNNYHQSKIIDIALIT